MSNIAESLYKPQLRIFYKLDERKLSPEFIDKVGREEGRTDYVDAEKARDLPWTEEIFDSRIGTALVDEDGDILAEFTGVTALARAEKARASVKVSFDVDIDLDEDEVQEEDESE